LAVTNQKIPVVATAPPGALARPDWRVGGPIAAADLRLEQEYSLQRIRRHLRLAHGWGVVCGLNVAAANEGDSWSLLVCPGYGVGPCGDEILLTEALRFNLRDYLWMRPVGEVGDRLWIAIDSVEDPAAYQDAAEPACGCGSDEAHEEVSRVVDGFRIVISWTPPQLYRATYNACAGGAPPCPICPDACGIPIASLVLPSPDEPILQSAIDNSGVY
jgi:hypothetical protein